MKVATLDIETSELSSVGGGVLLLAVLKPLGKRSVTFRYDEMGCRPGREGKLVKAVLDEIAQYDMVVGHNVIGFDWPWLKGRASTFGLPIAYPLPFCYDTLKAFRLTGFRTRTGFNGKPIASLAFAVDFFGIKQRKTAILPRQHWETIWAEGKQRDDAMKHLAEHCVSDCIMTEQLYLELLRHDTRSLIRRLT
mgnify:CR=1 FL=1